MHNVYVTAHRATNTMLENFKANQSLITDLQELGFYGTDCLGSFKEDGQEQAAEELSFCIKCETVANATAVQILATEYYEQDAVLSVDTTTNIAYLLSNDEAMEIGEFKAVPERQALKSECYTYINGTFFMVL